MTETEGADHGEEPSASAGNVEADESQLEELDLEELEDLEDDEEEGIGDDL